MSKPLKVVGTIAGVAALAVTGVGLAVGGTVVLAGTTISSAALLSVASSASLMGSQMLAKPPPARGSVSQILIQPDAPQPYCMGEGYFAGVLRHDTGYGATLNKVPNPYRFMPVVYSGGGPVESIEPRVDYSAVSSWYSGFLYTDTQLGACPEPDALSPHWAGAPGWTAASKLSGQAAIGWSFLFDKEGKRFASGIPLIGAYGQWVKVYDPRLDDTQPGGVGPHRLGDESTYEYSANPALHAGTYAYGRYQNGKRTFGIGLPADGIDWVTVMAWANVCEANGWTIFGVVYEPGDRWANLKDICFAGGGEPVPGGTLTFRYSAPVVALDTITSADLTDDNRSVMAMQPFRDRINTVIPKYRSPLHNWEIVDAEPVVNATFLAEDGEEKRDTWPFNLVKDKDQAAQLAAYRMFDTRELAPITLPCKPHMRHYRPGECLTVQDEELGLETDIIILKRQIDPVTMKVTFEAMGETPAKHAYCLGLVGVAPPTPALGQTAEERDQLAAAAGDPAGYIQQLISTSSQDIVTITATDSVITIGDHNRIYADKTVAVTGGTVDTLEDTATALNPSTRYWLYYDDPDRSGGAVTWKATVNFPTAQTSSTNPGRHYGGYIYTDTSGGSGTSGGGSLPPGSGGSNPYDTATP